MRNPKDACVSFCHHGNLFLGWRIDADSFAKLFVFEKCKIYFFTDTTIKMLHFQRCMVRFGDMCLVSGNVETI